MFTGPATTNAAGAGISKARLAARIRHPARKGAVRRSWASEWSANVRA